MALKGWARGQVPRGTPPCCCKQRSLRPTVLRATVVDAVMDQGSSKRARQASGWCFASRTRTPVRAPELAVPRLRRRRPQLDAPNHCQDAVKAMIDHASEAAPPEAMGAVNDHAALRTTGQKEAMTQVDRMELPQPWLHPTQKLPKRTSLLRLMVPTLMAFAPRELMLALMNDMTRRHSRTLQTTAAEALRFGMEPNHVMRPHFGSRTLASAPRFAPQVQSSGSTETV